MIHRFNAGSPSVPKVSPIRGTDCASPSSRHGYIGEYSANSPSTGRELSAREMRLRSLVSRNPAKVFDERPPTVKVRRSASSSSMTVWLVIDRLSTTASRSSAAPS